MPRTRSGLSAGGLAADGARQLRAPERARVALERQARRARPGEHAAPARARRRAAAPPRRGRSSSAGSRPRSRARRRGSNSRAASPATSGSEDAFEQATGHARAPSPRARAARSPRRARERRTPRRAPTGPRVLGLETSRGSARRRRRRRRGALAQLRLVPGRIAGQHEHRALGAAGSARARRSARARFLCGRLADRLSTTRREPSSKRARAPAPRSGCTRRTAPRPSGTTSIRSGSTPEQPDQVLAPVLRVGDHPVRAARRQRHEHAHARGP